MPALRNPPQEAVELIKSFEGIPDGDPRTVNIDPYLDPVGIWTIGWGHAIVDRGTFLRGAANRARVQALYPGGITRAQAETLLVADLLPRCASVLNLCRQPLSDGAFGALLAFVFNVGAANFAASTLLRKLNAGDMQGAADQFLVWNKARANGVLVVLRGLTRRRQAERAMFLGQDWRREAAAVVSRGASRRGAPEPAAEWLLPLPVPEPPDDQAVEGVARPTKARAAVKVAAKAVTKPKPKPKPKPAGAAAVKPRGRTTIPKARPPKPPAKRPARPAKR